MTNRWIYFFGNGQADGDASIKHLIGGKGASLAEMTRAGLNVPPGFTISAECCEHYYQHDRQWPDDLETQVRANLARLETLAGRPFGDGLLVAVRSGAAQSMPGMMDTLLNVGLNPACVAGDAWTAYRQFIEMYSHTVGGIENDGLTKCIHMFRAEHGMNALTAGEKNALTPSPSPGGRGEETLCKRLRDFYAEQTGRVFPTEPWAMLRDAINAVFESWNSDRAVLYRKHHKIDGLLGTAVTVQMMCPAEVAGVMFTANPVDQSAEIIIESAFGLGEAVVLGKVTPDRFVFDKASRTVTKRSLSDPKGASLNDDQILTLAELGFKVEAYFKTPCDIEWALSGGQFFLLQSREIQFRKAAPSFTVVERENVRAAEVAQVKALAEPGGTVWSRFNLAEILPEPTPMTWGIVRRFMSGKGGFGQMYRDLGFDPDPALDEIGMFDLICGRPYCNLSREPRMQYRNMPFEHRFEQLKKDPQNALYPQATFNPRRAGLLFVLKLPILFLKMWWSQIKQQQMIRTFAEDFTNVIVPRYQTEVAAAEREDWTKLSNQEVLGRLNAMIDLTLFDFARHSLKPTALAALMLANLERAFAARLKPADVAPAEAVAIGMQKAQAALRELMIGTHPDEQTDLAAGVRALQVGRISKDEFLRRFGHRGSQEMELSRPRWNEDPTALDSVSRDPKGSAERREPARVDDAWQNTWRKLADDARLLPGQRPAVEAELRRLQTYMALRETAKHHLMRGYFLIRRALLELDRRFELNGGIFYLTPDELQELSPSATDRIWLDRISERRRTREIALSLPVPTVIFSDDLDAIGRELAPSSAGAMQGVPLSAGVVEATAWVLDDIAGAEMPVEPYILVCPSTDPAWVPLFVHARGLVMETGGMLSHGAIVAREFGLPAVAGIVDVHRRIKTGQRLRIDGATGAVQIIG